MAPVRYFISRRDHISSVFENSTMTSYDLIMEDNPEDEFSNRKDVGIDEVARVLSLATQKHHGIEVYRASATGPGCPHIQSSAIHGNTGSIRVIDATGEGDDLLLIAKQIGKLADMATDRRDDKARRGGDAGLEHCGVI